MAKQRGGGFDSGPGEGVDEALGLLDQMNEVIENLPERTQARGAEFFEDVLGQAKDVCETIRRTNRVTEGQKRALDNWLAGIKKWDFGSRD